MQYLGDSYLELSNYYISHGVERNSESSGYTLTQYKIDNSFYGFLISPLWVGVFVLNGADGLLIAFFMSKYTVMTPHYKVSD